MAAIDGGDWQCGKSLTDSIEHMFTSGAATDVTFVVGEYADKVFAHKFILISRSPVFFAMLEGPMASEGEIEIPDIPEDSFVLFLRYLYTDSVKLTIHNVAPIYHVAGKYLVDKLTETCEEFLENHLTAENVCILMEQTHVVPDDKLKEECKRILKDYKDDVVKSSGFEDICHSCISDMISSDDLPLHEHLVYEAMMRWPKAECERQGLNATDVNKRNVLGSLLYLIRFPVMSAGYFCKQVCKTEILSDKERWEVHSFIHSDQKKNINLSEFNCSYRILAKKGKYVVVARGSAPNRFNQDVASADTEDFRCSVQIYLHGIKVCSDAESVSVQLMDSKRNCLYSGVHYCDEEDEDKHVVFNTIVKCLPSVSYTIAIKCHTASGTACSINQLQNKAYFDNSIILFRISGGEYDTATYKGHLAGLLISTQDILEQDIVVLPPTLKR